MRPAPISAAIVAAIASAVVGSGTMHRRAVRTQLNQWSGALELVKAFGDSSGLSTEIAAAIGPPALPLRNIALFSAVQSLDDRRAASAMVPVAPPASEALSPTSRAEAIKFMRFASSAYGAALMVVYGLIPAAPPVELKQLGRSTRVSELVWDSRSAICHHTGIAPSDLVRLETESLDVAGSSECLRHFVAVDHSSRAVILSIRGTASISDVLHDAVAYADPFCGGLAHAGMALMARAVWAAAGEDVRTALAQAPEDYELILTGHSLGAGVASLLTILLHDECPAVTQLASRVRCFAYAPPPVYLSDYTLLPSARGAKRGRGRGASAVPAHPAESSISAFIHSEDCVPFLSVDAGRRLLSGLRAVEEHANSQPPAYYARIALGRRAPDEALIRKAEAGARGDDLKPIQLAPSLRIPAACVVWLRPRTPGFWATRGGRWWRRLRTQRGASSAEDPRSYDAVVCSPALLCEQGIGLSLSMLKDHFVDGYERALSDDSECGG